MFKGKTHYRQQFSIAMLVYQRVFLQKVNEAMVDICGCRIIALVKITPCWGSWVKAQ